MAPAPAIDRVAGHASPAEPIVPGRCCSFDKESADMHPSLRGRSLRRSFFHFSSKIIEFGPFDTAFVFISEVLEQLCRLRRRRHLSLSLSRENQLQELREEAGRDVRRPHSPSQTRL